VTWRRGDSQSHAKVGFQHSGDSMSSVAWSIPGATAAVAVVLAILIRGRSQAIEKKGLTGSNRDAQDKDPKPGSPETEIDSTIFDWVDRKVREGFESREEIVEGVTEIVEDEYDLDDAAERVALMTERQIREHQIRQSKWSRKTDCDRIDLAFADLENNGIVARQNFTCCQSCGNAEIGEEIEEYSKSADPLGYVFYHMQDTEGACDGGSLYLAFGTVGGTDEDAVAVGERIRDALEREELAVRWCGTLGKRICITGLDWKKRRNDR